MKVNDITVGRKFNLGNFESLELRVTVSPSPDEAFKQMSDAVDEIIQKLDDEILKAYGKLKPKK